jgi:hypothetical protein
MSWSGGLYQGPNGNAFSEERKMYQRYHDFFGALQAGARDTGVKSLEIDADWVRENSPELIASRLGPGMAVSNVEGPNATPYKAEAGFLLDYFYPFYPAQGLPIPVRYIEELEEASKSDAPRLFYLIGDRFNRDLYFRVYDAFVKNPTQDEVSRLQLLRSVAAELVGEKNSSALLDAWLALNLVQRDTPIIDFGGTMFYLGSVQQRWLTRPFVPYPEQLKPEETQYYRKYQFQARSEARARDLDELQGTHQYQGLGGRALSGKLFLRMLAELDRARADVRKIGKTGDRQRYALFDKRLQVFQALVNNCQDAIEYQYDLDTVKAWKLQRPAESDFQVVGIKEWHAIRGAARREIDNTAVLIDLLESEKAPIIDFAKTNGDENIRVLGPELVDQLRKKMKIMIAHWQDYERLFISEDEKAAQSVAVPQ